MAFYILEIRFRSRHLAIISSLYRLYELVRTILETTQCDYSFEARNFQSMLVDRCKFGFKSALSRVATDDDLKQELCFVLKYDFVIRSTTNRTFSLSTNLSLRKRPEILAVAHLNLAGKLANFNLKASTDSPSNKPWWYSFNKECQELVIEGTHYVLLCELEEIEIDHSKYCICNSSPSSQSRNALLLS